MNFDVGPIHVAVLPFSEGRLSRFLLYRDRGTSGRVLIGSGSAHDTRSCIEQATTAARRAWAVQ